MRLINADNLLDKAYWHGDKPDYDNLYADGVEAVDVRDIESEPTVDAVRVIRCKDCIYGEKFINGDQNYLYCVYHESPMNINSFCSSGTNTQEDIV